MNFGHLSQVFSTFAWKRITPVEVDPAVSNGHEFNPSVHLRKILGTTTRSCKAGTGIPTKFFYFADAEDEVTEAAACMSWYDSRANNPKRTEWRLYYTDNGVIGRDGRARVEDFLVIAFAEDNQMATALVAEAGSTCESQLRWLFGITDEAEPRFKTAKIDAAQTVNMAQARILEVLGVVLPAKDDLLLERMLHRFGKGFPPSVVFGEFVRAELPDIHAKENPDAAIIAWMEAEEFAFRVLEKHIVGERLKHGFKDVDDFVNCSLSVHNRRKSRAGHAFENHLSAVFRAHGLVFERAATVENKAKPDFLFPGAAQYFDDGFEVELLTLLGAKTSCKDRWRQVLAEGHRIKQKHLVTLEPAISENQIDEMQNNSLQLVVPASLHETYPDGKRAYLWDMATFIKSVGGKQERAGIARNFTCATARPRHCAKQKKED